MNLLVKNIGIGKDAIRKAVTTRIACERIDEPMELVLNALDVESCKSLFNSMFQPMFHSAYFTHRCFTDYHLVFRVSCGCIMMNICTKDEYDEFRRESWKYVFEFDNHGLTDTTAKEFINFLLASFNKYQNESR